MMVLVVFVAVVVNVVDVDVVVIVVQKASGTLMATANLLATFRF